VKPTLSMPTWLDHKACVSRRPVAHGRMGYYWACAQVDARRERLALYCLNLAGYQTYVPHIRSPRKASVPLFPGYAFILIELQWHALDGRLASPA
jgi:hypothetical protein